MPLPTECSFYLPENWDVALRAMSAESGIPQLDYMRDAFRVYLDEVEEHGKLLWSRLPAHRGVCKSFATNKKNEHLLHELSNLSKQTRVPRSKIMRAAVGRYLEREMKESGLHVPGSWKGEPTAENSIGFDRKA